MDKIIVVACGTAFYAGLVAKYAIEHWTRIPCEVELASEFRYRDPIVGPTTLVVAISQSGETADTLMAIGTCRAAVRGDHCNKRTIPRESDAVIYTHAGPEIGVASTKGFLTQLVACYLLGLSGTCGRPSTAKSPKPCGNSPPCLMPFPRCDKIQPVMELAAEFADKRSVLFIGRHVDIRSHSKAP